MRLNRLGCFLLVLTVFLTSCEKEETPIALPPRGEAKIEQISMGGPSYPDQVFYDLENQKVVSISVINSWDLAFGSSVEGYPIFVNGAKDLYVYNTGQTDITQVTTAPDYNDKKWKYDAAEGMTDSTAFGQWSDNGISKGVVYVLKVNPAHNKDTFRKMKIITADDTHYEVMFGDLRSKEVTKVTIPIDAAYNFGYLSFNDGVVKPEPPKNDWDIVFTRYRYIYRELDNFPYLVNGVLLNPAKEGSFGDLKAKIQAARDSTLPPFQEVTADYVTKVKFSPYRDVIGWDWKVYSFDTQKYTVKKDRTYLIQSRNKQFFKFHFLDFYNNAGEGGNPSFEFDRLR
ncbi:MAG: hypothetical protein EOP51_04415 [Sphingobacteriales bacterium]|nr:MAG: hypothetical protein EOP51_04415 [Sphingobacteriales bacterium]